MASLHGIPLLSGPPSTNDTSDACRKCNKEFNILFTRSRKCNHCGYLYCHSCSDYQALLPRAGPDRGYDPVHVCAYCIELLNITAAGTGQLRGLSLSKLKSYADAYNINISRAVEKADIVEAIIRAREQNGCLPQSKEDYYRKNKVPNPHAGSRPRGIFSRSNTSNNPPPVPPRPQAQTGHSFPRPDLSTGDPPPTPPRPQSAFPQPIPPRTQYQYPPHYNPPPPQPQPPPYGHYTPPYQQYHPGYHSQQQHFNVPPYHPSFSQPQHPPPQPPPQETRPPPPPPPRPNTSSTYRHATQSPSEASPPPPPPRQRTASTPQRPPPPPAPAPAPAPTPAIPLPTLDQLLVMTQASVSALPISVLKNILFTNHVNASMILEKSELVKKVMTLIDDERRERERQRLAEEAERLEEEERRREREEAIQRQQEEKRRKEEEERLKKERRERQRARVEEVEDGVDDMMDVEVEVSEGEDDDEPLSNARRDESEGAGNRPSTPVSMPSTPPKPASPPQKASMMSALERTGLCVICQDEEANIAIVDCGHLAMCRACSELVMASSKECPLCRTRIVTEARLLRIFKT